MLRVYLIKLMFGLNLCNIIGYFNYKLHTCWVHKNNLKVRLTAMMAGYRAGEIHTNIPPSPPVHAKNSDATLLRIIYRVILDYTMSIHNILPLLLFM